VPPELKSGKYEVQVDLRMGPFGVEKDQKSVIEI
jgi:hypothetical protein